MDPTLLLLGGIVLLLVVAVAAILIVGRRRSKTQEAKQAKQLVAGSKERRSVIRLQQQAARFPVIGTIRQMVIRAELYDQVEAADLARDVSLDDVVRMKELTMLVCALAGGLVAFLLGGIVGALVGLFGGMVLGYAGPDSGIRRAAELRQARISAALPLAMEVVGLTAERTSIDSSLSYYCKYFGNETLAEELGYVMDRVERLRERMDVAMGEMLRKNHNDDLSFLVAAVGQASQLGGRDLRGMLEKRSFELRIKRDQEIKSRALRAPVLMTFPTMLNVLALMIALGGLAALQLGSGGRG